MSDHPRDDQQRADDAFGRAAPESEHSDELATRDADPRAGAEGSASDEAHAARGESGADAEPAIKSDAESAIAHSEPAIESDLSELEEQFEHDLESIVAERDQFKDIAMRLQADFENYRKRVAVQSAEEIDRATGRLAEAFLPVLDAAEAAYLRHPDEVGPLLNVMLAELKKHGLEALDLDGQPFDPEVAEAVAHDDTGSGDVVVTEVLRSGYRWKGKTLRPAMVRTRG